jgi:hypothetical protein
MMVCKVPYMIVCACIHMTYASNMYAYTYDDIIYIHMYMERCMSYVSYLHVYTYEAFGFLLAS